MTLSPLRSLGITEWMLLVGLSILWGGSYLFMKLAVLTVPLFTIVLGRVSIAALALLIVLTISGTGIPKGRRIWLAFFGMGIFNNVIPMSLIVFSQNSISVGLASILNSITPLFTILVAHMTGPELVDNFGVAALGEWACLGAALSYACANTFGRRFVQLGTKPMQTAFGQVVASTVILGPLVIVVDQPWTISDPGFLPVLSILALGLFCTALAYVIYFQILARSGATAIALVTFMIPPSAILMGWLALGEQISSQDFLGLSLIGVGLFSVNRQSNRKA